MNNTYTNQILPYLPKSLQNMVSQLDEQHLADLEELRIKPHLPILCRLIILKHF